MLGEPERNFAVEARMMLQGLTGLMPTIDHLRALDEHYQVMLIRIANDLETVKRKALNG